MLRNFETPTEWRLRWSWFWTFMKGRSPSAVSNHFTVLNGSPDSTVQSFLLFSFQLPFFLWTKLGLFLVFPFAFVFFSFISHICSSAIFLHLASYWAVPTLSRIQITESRGHWALVLFLFLVFLPEVVIDGFCDWGRRLQTIWLRCSPREWKLTTSKKVCLW